MAAGVPVRESGAVSGHGGRDAELSTGVGAGSDVVLHREPAGAPR
jgi:hypothetical protein